MPAPAVQAAFSMSSSCCVDSTPNPRFQPLAPVVRSNQKHQCPAVSPGTPWGQFHTRMPPVKHLSMNSFPGTIAGRFLSIFDNVAPQRLPCHLMSHGCALLDKVWLCPGVGRLFLGLSLSALSSGCYLHTLLLYSSAFSLLLTSQSLI